MVKKDIMGNYTQDMLEEKLLSCILNKNDAIVDVADIIKEDMFASSLRANIFYCMNKLYADKTYFKEDVLMQHLISEGMWDNNIDHNYLTHTIKNSVTSSLQAKGFAKQIKDNYFKRILRKSAQELLDKSDQLSAKQLEECFDNIVLKIKDIDPNKNAIEKVEIKTQSLIDILNDKIDCDEVKIDGLRTGFYNIDRALNGLLPARVTNITADSRTGKTTFLMNIITNVAVIQPESKVLIISGEMTKEQLEEKQIVQLSGISPTYLKYPKLYFNQNDLIFCKNKISEKDKQEFFDKIRCASEQANKLNVFVDDGGTPDLQDIVIKAKRFKIQNKRLDILAIDHTNLVKVDSVKENEYLRLKIIYETLKKLAKELNCHILALHQLNNDIKNSENYRPKVSQIKGSSDIKDNSDNVLLIWRPEIYSDLMITRPDLKGVCEIDFAKIREGELQAPLRLAPFDGVCFKEL